MGLDIMAISNLEKKFKLEEKLKSLPFEVRPVVKKTRIKIDITPYGSKHGGFNKCEDMEGGKYTETNSTTEHHFRAGSYSGYNRFRKLLCEALVGVEDEILWANPDLYKDHPGFEMINFSDCEGILGTLVCQKLYSQLLENRDKFIAYLENEFLEESKEISWEIETYDDFLEGFRLGSQNGIVVYT
jgi:hypothetical protein